MAEDTTVTGLARAVAEFDSASLRPEVIEQTKLLVLDTLGCAIAAEGNELVDQMRRVAQALGGAPQATLFGGEEKSTVLNAILVNGTLVRVLDLNDYSVKQGRRGQLATGGHPSDNIPAALAVGEWQQKSGREVLGGIALVYEICARLNTLSISGGTIDNTSLSGIAVAAMAGQLMGMGAGRIGHGIAYGAARCMAPQLMRRGQISAGKSLSNSLVAQSGVLGAMIAAERVSGPIEVLDHPLGIRGMFSEDADFSTLVAPFDAVESILGNHIKAYPCVATGQAAVAAALDLHDTVKDKTGEIAKIRIVMADDEYVRGQQGDAARADPQSHAAADHSFAFIVAAALTDGVMTPHQYDNERWFDPEIRALMDKTEMGNDAALNQKGPSAFPARVEVTMADGITHSAEVPYPPGFSKGHLNRAEVIQKFETFTAEKIDEARMESIKALALRLDELESVDELMASLAEPVV